MNKDDIYKILAIIIMGLVVAGAVWFKPVETPDDQEPDPELPDEFVLNFMGIEISEIICKGKILWFDYQVEKEGPGYIESLETFIYIDDMEIYSTYDYVDSTDRYTRRVIYQGKYPYDISGIKYGQIIAKAGDKERIHPFSVISDTLTFASEETMEADLHPVFKGFLYNTSMYYTFSFGKEVKVKSVDFTGISWGWAGTHKWRYHIHEDMKGFGGPFLVTQHFCEPNMNCTWEEFIDLEALNLTSDEQVGKYFTVSQLQKEDFITYGTIKLDCYYPY